MSDVKQEKAKRTCAYCGQPRCRCKYREGKMADFTISMSNISEQTTVGEMLEAIRRDLGNGDPARPCVFRISVSYLDSLKLAKAKAKRETEVSNG